MRIHGTIITIGLGLVLAAVGVSVALVPARAADQKPPTVVVSAGATAVAAGAVEDTLAICLGRIPQSATAGQRMMAEQTCRRDEAGRASARAIPGR